MLLKRSVKHPKNIVEIVAVDERGKRVSLSIRGTPC